MATPSYVPLVLSCLCGLSTVSTASAANFQTDTFYDLHSKVLSEWSSSALRSNLPDEDMRLQLGSETLAFARVGEGYNKVGTRLAPASGHWDGEVYASSNSRVVMKASDTATADLNVFFDRALVVQDPFDLSVRFDQALAAVPPDKNKSSVGMLLVSAAELVVSIKDLSTGDMTAMRVYSQSSRIAVKRNQDGFTSVSAADFSVNEVGKWSKDDYSDYIFINDRYETH